MTVTSFRFPFLILFYLLLLSVRCYSADIIFIRWREGGASEQRDLKTAADFYGLNLTVVTISSGNHDPAVGRALERTTTVGVAIAASVLHLIDQKTFLRSMNRRPSGKVPLLILGVTPETDINLLRVWSGGAAIRCAQLPRPGPTRYVIGRLEGFTRQLTDVSVPMLGSGAFYFVLNDISKAQQVSTLHKAGRAFPVFLRTTLHGVTVFLDCTAPSSSQVAEEGAVNPMLTAFVTIAPEMMFIKHCAGERGWHTVHPYANLTIDDPWLREPYGSLSYSALLGAMERYNFHSTIAFIPWNYDRSEREVIALIRKHPKRFSISVHGNNHDHKEFNDFRTTPLADQMQDIRQSLTRMNVFETRTGIPYDKVMVFPHSIGPEKTLAALKNNNYLATVNSSNVPMDVVRPSGLAFDLRATTLSFGSFPSIRRYSVEGAIPDGLLAVNAFLENPLLFYCHQGYFAAGIGAFNSQAEYVNRLQPDTRWSGLGDIVRHSYVVKLRDDDDYDVLSFSNNNVLENGTGRHALFYFRKEEAQLPAAVTVDGEPWAFVLQNGYLAAQVPIGAGKARTLSIKYENALQSPAIGTEKRSLRVYCIRFASDFRDIVLARYTPGRSIIRIYKEYEERLALVLVCVIAVVGSSLFGIWRLCAMLKERALQKAEPDQI